MTIAYCRHALALALYVALPCGAARADDAPMARVETVPARQGNMPEIVTAYGSAIPALEGGNAISLQQDGRVAQILVTPGDLVHAGQRLMVFDLAASGVSTYQQAVSAYTLAQSERSHTTQLFAQKLATRDQVAQANKAVSDAQTALDALRRQGADRPRTDVTAPYDGVVNTIPVAQGDHVTAGAALLTLTRLGGSGVDGLVVTVGVEPSMHARVQPGQSVVLHRLGTNGQDLTGHVLRIDGVLNAKTRLVDVDIGVDRGSLLSGEVFEADIAIGTLQGWLVPHGSVLQGDDGDTLFQVKAGKAVRVGVQDLGSRGDTDVVSGKLEPSLPVVTDGATQVSDGDPVQAAAMPAPNSPAGAEAKQ